MLAQILFPLFNILLTAPSGTAMLVQNQTTFVDVLVVVTFLFEFIFLFLFDFRFLFIEEPRL
jgi:hypothetical protein